MLMFVNLTVAGDERQIEIVIPRPTISNGMYNRILYTVSANEIYKFCISLKKMLFIK